MVPRCAPSGGGSHCLSRTRFAHEWKPSLPAALTIKVFACRIIHPIRISRLIVLLEGQKSSYSRTTAQEKATRLVFDHYVNHIG
jgi:hypothetical protein